MQLIQVIQQMKVDSLHNVWASKSWKIYVLYIFNKTKGIAKQNITMNNEQANVHSMQYTWKTLHSFIAKRHDKSNIATSFKIIRIYIE